MIRKLTFLSLTLAIISTLAMEKESKFAAAPALQLWVQEAKSVYVESLKLNENFSIEDDTTILDIKNRLLNNEGIPVWQSVLQPLYKESNWLIPTRLTPDTVGPELENNENVKKIMNNYNTSRLALSLKLQRPQDN